jgi:ribosomal protein L14
MRAVGLADTVVDFNNEPTVIVENKGNNKITELRTILQRESQNS